MTGPLLTPLQARHIAERKTASIAVAVMTTLGRPLGPKLGQAIEHDLRESLENLRIEEGGDGA